MKPVISELDYRLSGIRRFTLLPVSKQSVAEHAFNVARIALRIWTFLKGPKEQVGDLLIWAIHHDDPEYLSGDIPTMIKPYFDEERFIRDHADLIDHPRPELYAVVRVVKLADMLEGYAFLCRERAIGNTYIAAHIASYPSEIWAMLAERWPEMPPELREWVTLQIRELANPVSQRISRTGR